MDCTVFFIASFLAPITLGLLSFIVDGRKADIYLVFNLSLITIIYLLGTILYFESKEKIVHVILVKNNILGEFYGLIVDPYSITVGLVVLSCGILFLVYSIDYLSKDNRLHPVRGGKGRFYGWMLLFMGSTLAFLHASTLIEALIFFELMSLSCWGVISYYGSARDIISANKALLYTHVGAVLGLYLASFLSLYYIGDTSLFSLSNLPAYAKTELLLLVMVASLAKSAQFPFYSWLLDAMVAPTPASAFLHGAAMIEMGVYLLGRIAQFINATSPIVLYVLVLLMVITCIICILMYPLQVNAKKFLAYSTIGEAMTMYIGVVYALAGSSIGLKATIAYLVNHAFIKGLGFLIVGVFEYTYGTHNMRHISNLILKSKLLSMGWFTSIIGLSGAPPFSLFFGKMLILASVTSVETLLYLIPVFAMIVYSCVFFIVGISWVNRMIFSECEEENLAVVTKIPTLMKYSIISLIVFSLTSHFLFYNMISQITIYGGLAS